MNLIEEYLAIARKDPVRMAHFIEQVKRDITLLVAAYGQDIFSNYNLMQYLHTCIEGYLIRHDCMDLFDVQLREEGSTFKRIKVDVQFKYEKENQK